jgi:NitT/TauT family transport system permease protein
VTFDFSRKSDVAIAIISPVVLLAAWQLAVSTGFLDSRFVPAPLTILQSLGDMIVSGELLSHILVSLGRILAGFVLGVGAGVIVGLTMGIFRPVRAALTPIVAALFPIPKLAILPILILFFGLGEVSKVLVIAIGVFFISAINTVSGVINIDRIYLDVARNLGVSGRNFYFNIAIPGALPSIVTGAKVSMGVALLLIVAAEFVGASSGIGYLIWSSWQNFSLDRMFVGLVTLATLGYVFTMTLELLESRLLPWRPNLR